MLFSIKTAVSNGAGGGGGGGIGMTANGAAATSSTVERVVMWVAKCVL